MFLDQQPTLRSVRDRCACGREATANGRECGVCFRERVGSVRIGFSPTRSPGAGMMDPARSRRWDTRLQRYADTRREGIQPRGTKNRDIDEARRLSDKAQAAFRADAPSRLRSELVTTGKET